MDGKPVWLCSVSHRDKPGRAGRIIGTADWKLPDFAMAERLAHAALCGVGDSNRERAFRMNITFCLHRAISPQEQIVLPAAWNTAPGGLAGGPVEILWSRGIEHRPAAMPCRNPRRLRVAPGRPDLWVPEDCRQCEPCRARRRCREETHVDLA